LNVRAAPLEETIMLRTKPSVITMSYLLVMLAVGPAVAEHSPGDCPSPENGWRCGYVMRMKQELGRGGSDRGPGDPQPESNYTDVLHTWIDIDVDPTARTIFGRVSITAASRIPHLSEFIVYLDPYGGQMDVIEVGGDAAGPSSFTHVGDKVTVDLAGSYNPGQEFMIWLEYGGTPRPNDGIFWGSHYNGSETVDIVATLSETWHARTWWVGKDHLNDKCTFDIWLTVPDTLVAVSNGILEATTPMGGNKIRYEWAEINPMIPYLASMAIADYDLYPSTYNHLGDTMPMSFYILPEYNSSTWRGYCDTYVTMTEVFSDAYGQYPFVNEKGGMAHTPTLGPFMEHQTIPSMPTFSILWINAHELAHQWWGDNVTCQTWGDIWLNEGITSFSEAVWEEFKPGGGTSAYHSHMAGRWPYNTDSQLYVTDVNDEGAIFSSIVYDKGAWVTHMLRHVLGDETFFQAMLDYRAAYGGDSATTAEFAYSISNTVGYDVSFFTDQWVMNPGSPDYEYGWQHGQAAGQDYLLLRIDQTQVNRGYDLMTMPVDIAVTTGSGTTTYVVWCIDAFETCAIPIDGTPTQVALDPDDWILTHSVALASLSIHPLFCQGDLDEDGRLDALDIQAFVQALLDSATWPGVWRRSDMDFDGRCDLNDLPLFVDALLGGCELP
jgi:aminopeptidase N